MLVDGESVRLNYTRIFNFNEKRVSLRMEASEGNGAFVPVGRVGVCEIPTNNGRVTCSCVLTEFESGRSERVILRLKNTQEREKSARKYSVFSQDAGDSRGQAFGWRVVRFIQRSSSPNFRP